MKLIDTGYVESITLQYNIMNRQLEEGIAHAGEKNVGVVIMGPVAGGRLGVDTEVLGNLIDTYRRVPELALRFVLANPNVTVALSGMSTMQHVEENLAIAAEEVSLSAEDTAAIAQQLDKLKAMADLYCTGCEYCMPCPEQVAIPPVFDLYNQARVYGLWNDSRGKYAKFQRIAPKRGMMADACTQCGTCEDKCPQDIPIRKQLAEAHKALTGKKE